MTIIPFIKKNWILFVFALFIFLISIIARINSYLDVINPAFSSSQYYQGIGSGSDSDYQITNALFTLNKIGPTEIFTHYDYVFLIPIITLFINFLGYIKGIEYLMYFTILLGSLVPVIIFMFFAQRTKFLVGSIIAGLTLALNPLLLSISAGRFVLDTLVQFIFAIFIVCYLQALGKKSLVWLVLLGIIAFIQGLNKPFLIINDLALFLIFPLFLLIKTYSFKRDFPFLKIVWSINKKKILYALIPSLVYFGCNIAWEIFIQFIISKQYPTLQKGYFLMDIFFSKGADSSTSFALRDSIINATPIEKIRNVTMLTLMAIEQLIQYINLSLYFFVSFIAVYLFSKTNKIRWIIWSTLVFLFLLGSYYSITKIFFMNNTLTPIPQNWTMQTFINFSLITLLLLFFMQRSITLLAMTAMKIPYLVAVGLTITTAIFPRHYETLVMWFIVCFALWVDSFMPQILSRFTSFVYKFVIVIILITFVSPVMQTITDFKNTVGNELRDKAYLTWVKEQIPKGGYILSGTGENFINIAKYTEQPILYNTTHIPRIANYNDTAFSIKDFSAKQPFTNFLPDYAKQHRLFVTDLNKHNWDLLLTSGSKAEIPKNKYILKEFAHNKKTGRILYQLIINK